MLATIKLMVCTTGMMGAYILTRSLLDTGGGLKSASRLDQAPSLRSGARD